MWSYDPENERDVNNVAEYIFKNSSGNPINNVKNRKINLTEIYSSNAELNDLDDITEDVTDDIEGDETKDAESDE